MKDTLDLLTACIAKFDPDKAEFDVAQERAEIEEVNRNAEAVKHMHSLQGILAEYKDKSRDCVQNAVQGIFVEKFYRTKFDLALEENSPESQIPVPCLVDNYVIMGTAIVLAEGMAQRPEASNFPINTISVEDLEDLLRKCPVREARALRSLLEEILTQSYFRQVSRINAEEMSSKKEGSRVTEIRQGKSERLNQAMLLAPILADLSSLSAMFLHLALGHPLRMGRIKAFSGYKEAIQIQSRMAEFLEEFIVKEGSFPEASRDAVMELVDEVFRLRKMCQGLEYISDKGESPRNTEVTSESLRSPFDKIRDTLSEEGGATPLSKVLFELIDTEIENTVPATLNDYVSSGQVELFRFENQDLLQTELTSSELLLLSMSFLFIPKVRVIETLVSVLTPFGKQHLLKDFHV